MLRRQVPEGRRGALLWAVSELGLGTGWGRDRCKQQTALEEGGRTSLASALPRLHCTMYQSTDRPRTHPHVTGYDGDEQFAVAEQRLETLGGGMRNALRVPPCRSGRGVREDSFIGWGEEM